jgi:cysteine desulfurase family protein (TIGR01976 family)
MHYRGGMPPVAAGLDLQAIRSRFPALARQTPDGKPIAYLDGPGGSQVPVEVADAMRAYLLETNANLGGAFAASRASDELIHEARVAASDMVGASPDEVAFGANMTSLNFQLAHSVARTLQPGDEIITTTLDHDANVSPWLLVARDHGLTVRVVRMRSEDCTLQAEDISAALTDRTRVVAFPLASNAVGSVPDARQIAALAHDAGALAWADAVHYAPHRRIDVGLLGVDVLLCSPYKFFGPHLGVAFGARELLAAWPADRVRPADQSPPGHRYETGTLSHEALAGMVAAIDYLASLGDGVHRRARLDDAFARIHQHEEELALRALAGLRGISSLRLYGIADEGRLAERTPTFAFTLDGVTPRRVAEGLADEGIAVWDGNYYALALMEQLGLEERGGAVRAGFLHYTTAEEVDRLLEALTALAG